MRLYLAPMVNRAPVEEFLRKNYPHLKVTEQSLATSAARTLVLQICNDTSIVQPAVKLLSPYDSLRYSALLGVELHFNGGFVEMITTDHRESQFLFNSEGLGLNNMKWTLIELVA